MFATSMVRPLWNIPDNLRLSQSRSQMPGRRVVAVTFTFLRWLWRLSAAAKLIQDDPAIRVLVPPHECLTIMWYVHYRYLRLAEDTRARHLLKAVVSG
jgi:hypothetical protein